MSCLEPPDPSRATDGRPALVALLGDFDRYPSELRGRVNRLVAGSVDAIATSYETVERLKDKHLPKTHLVGNPVRESVLALRDRPYPALDEAGIFRVRVTGGTPGPRSSRPSRWC